MSVRGDLYFPALVGFIDHLPMPWEGWTAERRQEWLAAFELLLDFSVPVKESK